MEPPVIAACIAAVAAVLIAVAQIVSQWLLVLRAERRAMGSPDTTFYDLNRALRRRFLTPKLFLFTVLQLTLIVFSAYFLGKQPMTTMGVLILTVQVAALFSLLVTSWVTAFCVVSLRYALTGETINQSAE